MFGFLSKRDSERNLEKILSEISSVRSFLEEQLQQMQRQERRRQTALESILDSQNRTLDVLARLERHEPLDALMALAENFALTFLSEPENAASQVLFGKLTDLLDCFDLSLIMDVNEAFDPERHEACDVRGDRSKQENSVIEIVRPGFLRGGHVLRCATVIVNRYDAASGDASEEL
ncbi:hypothetical protein FACS1894187_02060 [Synergistales bacterium]|nr:hypothetical protein FACS1894187_02060 [Synergistales bacterium]